MAVITEINGVSTAGTTGVNNIFGSGTGGGTVNTTTTPSFTVANASTFGGNEMLVTNSLSYTQPTFNLTVEDPNGTVVVDNEYEIETTNGFYLLRWTGAGNAGTHTVKLRVQEFGDFYDSPEVTATYTKAAAKFQYWRIYGTNNGGQPQGHHMGIREWQMFTGSSATGTQHPAGSMSAASNSASDEAIGNTSLSGYIADRGNKNYAYPAWRAFDGNMTNNAPYAWTLGASATDNWIELEFDVGSTEFPTTADLPEIKSHRLRNYGGDQATYYTVYASNTGAFGGEEERIALIDATAGTDQTYTF